MSVLQEVLQILQEALQLEDVNLSQDSALLGELAEFDSMAVVVVITSLEDKFDIVVEDDEISAETFETVDSLVDFINEKKSK
jgi:acyl carrier protein